MPNAPVKVKWLEKTSLGWHEQRSYWKLGALRGVNENRETTCPSDGKCHRMQRGASVGYRINWGSRLFIFWKYQQNDLFGQIDLRSIHYKKVTNFQAYQIQWFWYTTGPRGKNLDIHAKLCGSDTIYRYIDSKAQEALGCIEQRGISVVPSFSCVAHIASKCISPHFSYFGSYMQNIPPKLKIQHLVEENSMLKEIKELKPIIKFKKAP